MFRDDGFSFGPRNQLFQVGWVEANYHDQQKVVAESLKRKASAERTLQRAYTDSGEIIRDGDYLSGGEKLYKIATGEAQIIVERMQEAGKIREGKVNTMKGRPIEI
jgi:hypothetical protein